MQHYEGGENKQMRYRVLSMILAVVMLVTTIDVTAFAAQVQDSIGNSSENTTDEDEIASFSEYISNAVAIEAEEQTGNAIVSVDITGNVAEVEYSALKEAVLVVAIYDEEGSALLAAGKTEVTTEERAAQVTIDTGVIPQYFYVRVFLIDKIGAKPLCPVYDSPMYTEEMQELLNSTVYDYEADRVLNFDESIHTNFAVLAEDVVVIRDKSEEYAVVQMADSSQMMVGSSLSDNDIESSLSDNDLGETTEEDKEKEENADSEDNTEDNTDHGDDAGESNGEEDVTEDNADSTDIPVSGDGSENEAGTEENVEDENSEKEEIENNTDEEENNIEETTESNTGAEDILEEGSHTEETAEDAVENSDDSMLEMTSQQQEVRIETYLSSVSENEVHLLEQTISKQDTEIEDDGDDDLFKGENYVASADLEKLVFVIENPDLEVQGLRRGDKFTYIYKEHSYSINEIVLFIEIESVSREFDKITVQGKQPDSINDYISDTKIEEEADKENATADSNVCDKNFTYEGMEEDQIKDEHGETINALTINVKLKCKEKEYTKPGKKVEIKGTADLRIKFSFAANVNFYKKNNVEHCEFKHTTQIGFNGEAALNIKGTFPIVNIVFTAGPVLLQMPLNFVIEGEINGSVDGYAQLIIGFVYSEGEFVNISTPPRFDGTKVEVEGKVFFGFELEPEVDVFFSMIAEVGVSATAGVEISGKLWEYDSLEPEDDSCIHTCALCIDGDVKAALKVGFKGTLFYYFEVNKEITPLSKKIGDWYFCMDMGDGHDHDRFGFTECPAKQYKVQVTVYDTNKYVVEDAMILLENEEGILIGSEFTDENGCWDFYLSSGVYKFVIKIKGEIACERNITVRNAPRHIKMFAHGDYSIKVVQAVSGGGASPAGAITEDGWLYLWADDYLYGQEGVSCEPTPMLDYVEKAYYEDGSVLAITNTGALYVWGDNENDKLGFEGDDIVTEPYELMTDVKEVYFKNDTTLVFAVLKKNGELWMWGQNTYAQLAESASNTYISVPKKIDISGKVIDFGFGLSTCYALTEDGYLYYWGDTNRTTPISILANVKSMATPGKDYLHGRTVGSSVYLNLVAAVTNGGELYMYGNNYAWVISENVGNGITTNGYPMNGIDAKVKSVRFAPWVSSSTVTMQAVTEDGAVYVWGTNGTWGSCGVGSTDVVKSPTRILDKVKVKEIGGRDGYGYALSEDGTMYQWGCLGITDGPRMYSPIECLKNVKQVSITRYNSNDILAVTEAGELYSWGYNFRYTASQSGAAGYEVTYPKKLDEDVKCVQTYTPYYIKNDGTLYRIYKTLEEIELKANVQTAEVQLLQEEEQLLAEEEQPLLCTVEWDSVATALTQSTTEEIAAGSSEFTGLKANGIYNFYVVKTKEAEDILASENLLYIGQYMADENGNLNISYIPKENADTAEAFVVGMEGKHLANAQIVVEDLYDTGAEQKVTAKVTYEGTELTEGVDYELSGDFSVTNVGEYSLTVEGIGEYEGSQEVRFYVWNTGASVCTVEFKDEDGTLMFTKRVESGTSAAEPEKPEKERQNFSGWYLNDEKYDFSQPVNENLILTARWSLQEQLPRPTVDLEPGTYYSGTKITLSTVEGAYIYYTTDGSDPAVSGELYADAIVLAQDMILKAVAVKEEWVDSEVISYEYYINKDSGDVLPEDIPEGGLAEIPEGLWIAGINEEGYLYTGNAVKPEIRVYDHLTLLKQGADYTVSYKNNKNAKEASEKNAPSITVTGKGNYSGKDTVTFTIHPIEMEDVIVKNTVIYTNDDTTGEKIFAVYNGKIQKPVPTLAFGNRTLKNRTDYTVEYPDMAEVTDAYMEKGTYNILLKGKGNYTGEKKIKLTITDANLMSNVTVSKISDQLYNKDGVTVENMTEVPTVKWGKTELKNGIHYSVSYEGNKKVGTAVIIFTGTGVETQEGIFVGEKRVNFKIKGIDIRKANVTGIPKTKKFTGQPIQEGSKDWTEAIEVTLKGQETPLPKSCYKVEYLKNTEAGTATVVITGEEGYSGILKKTFKITPYDLSEKENSEKKIAYSIKDVYPYAKGGCKPEPQITYNGKILVKDKDYKLFYRNHTKVNDGSDIKKLPIVIIKGKGNFKGNISLNYQIEAQDLSNLKEHVIVSDKVYSPRKNAYKAMPKLTDLDGKVLKAGKDYEVTQYRYGQNNELEEIAKKTEEEIGANDILPIGTVVEVVLTGKGSNYTGTVSAEYRITASDFSKAKIVVDSQIYTGEEIFLDKSQITVKIGQTELSYGTDYEIVENSYRNNLKKGTASVTIKGIGNYGGTKTVRFAIRYKSFMLFLEKLNLV